MAALAAMKDEVSREEFNYVKTAIDKLCKAFEDFKATNAAKDSVQRLPISGVTQRRPAMCFLCQETSHFVSACPLKEKLVSLSKDAGDKGTYHANGVKGATFDRPLPCIELQYGIRTWKCDLDSGADYSMVPEGWLTDEQIVATGEVLRAINGQELRVVGKAEIPLKLDGWMTLWTSAFVVAGIKNPVLGLEWLKRHGVIWEFATDTVMIATIEVPLVARDSAEAQPGAGVSYAASPAVQEVQWMVRATHCAVGSSSSTDRQPRSETESEDRGDANSQELRGGGERRQQGCRGRPRAGLRRRGCFRCNESHRVRNCPYDPQIRRQNLSSSETETANQTERGSDVRETVKSGLRPKGRRRSCFLCDSEAHVLRSCPYRKGQGQSDRGERPCVGWVTGVNTVEKAVAWSARRGWTVHRAGPGHGSRSNVWNCV